MTEQNVWEKRYHREKVARKQAESLLETKSLELYELNLSLQHAQNNLQAKVLQRTSDLEKAVRKLKKEIEKRHAAEKELRQSRDVAVEISELKTKFLAGMSHEIRTPLNAIIGFAGLLDESDPGQKQKKYMRNIKSSSLLLLRLINDILDHSKIEADKLELEYSTVGIELLVKQSISLLMLEAERKGISFEFKKPRSLPHDVIVDSGRLQQILLNLLSNAVKYSDGGAVTVELAIDPSPVDKEALPDELTSLPRMAASKAHLVVISVEDRGYGIRQKDLDSLFSPFTQFSGAGVGSTGLGLAICRRICQLMGGSIDVKSTFGQGSIFTVRIPVGLPEKAAAGEIAASDQELETTSLVSNSETGAWLMTGDLNTGIQTGGAPIAHDKPLSILLADDYKVNRMVQQSQLEHLGYRADAVANGEEVLRALYSRPYDVILMDIRMPVMDGLECTRRIRRNKKGHQPYIVAVTASALAGDKERFEQIGMDAYISKPVDMQELAAVLSQAHDRCQSQRINAAAGSSTSATGALLDLDKLYQKLGTATDSLLHKVIPVYLREQPGREAALRNAFAANDIATFAQICHGLKGSSLSLGAEKLAQQCSRYEQLGNEDKLPTVSEIDALLELSRQTGQELRDKLEQLTATAATL